MQRPVRARVSGPQAGLLKQLVSAYPDSVSRAELSRVAGLDGSPGNFRSLVGDMIKGGVAERSGVGEVRLADWVMLK